MSNLVQKASKISSTTHAIALLTDSIRNIIATEKLAASQEQIKAIAETLNINYLQCAAALALICLNPTQQIDRTQGEGQLSKINPQKTASVGIRLVRYRLDVGRKHQVTIDMLKKVLVEESGVDINNIANVRINEDFTLLDLPDEMPQEIFHHLKDVEINTQKLAIKRLRYRSKKRGTQRFKRTNQNKQNLSVATMSGKN